MAWMAIGWRKTVFGVKLYFGGSSHPSFKHGLLVPSFSLLFADELDIHLLPKDGYQWIPKGEVVEVVTPGVNQKRYLAGALDTLTGQVIACVGERKTRWLFLELLKAIDASGRRKRFVGQAG